MSDSETDDSSFDCPFLPGTLVRPRAEPEILLILARSTTLSAEELAGVGAQRDLVALPDHALFESFNATLQVGDLRARFGLRGGPAFEAIADVDGKNDAGGNSCHIVGVVVRSPRGKIASARVAKDVYMKPTAVEA